MMPIDSSMMMMTAAKPNNSQYAVETPPTPTGFYPVESPPTGFTLTSGVGNNKCTSLITKNEQRPIFYLPNYHSSSIEIEESFENCEDELTTPQHAVPHSAPVLYEAHDSFPNEDPSSLIIRQRSRTVFVFPNTNQDRSSIPLVENKNPPTRNSSQHFSRPEGICLLRSISFTAKQLPSIPSSHNFSTLQQSLNRRASLSSPDLYPGLPHSRHYAPPTPIPYDLSEASSEFSDSEFADLETSGFNKHPTWSWRNKFGFFILGICQALGLSNVWRFPYFCYTNGGGSFFLAYLILLVACTAPFLCMEFAVGQFTQDHAISAIMKICPLMKGVGVAGIFTTFWLTTCYSVLIAWTVFYLFNSLYATPRWTSCKHGWNTPNCIVKPGSLPMPSTTLEPTASLLAHTGISTATSRWVHGIHFQNVTHSVTELSSTMSTKIENAAATTLPSVGSNLTLASEEFFSNKLLEVSKGINDLGELRFELLAVIIFTWVFIFVALRKPSILVGHSRYVLAILPHILLLIFAIRSLLFEGSSKGIRYFFKPKWEDLQNVKVWLYALAQTFHSLGVVLGFGIAVGSCNKLNNDMMRDTMIFMAANVYTQVIVCIAVFGTIGHLAHMLKRPVETALSHDPGLVFVVFSEIVAEMPVPTLWAILFFVSLTGVAIDSQVFLVQTIISALKEAFRNVIKKYFHGHLIFTLVLYVSSLLCSILFLTQAGIYFFQLADHYICVLSIVSLSLVEIVTVSWIYGAGRLSNVIYQMVNKRPSFYFIFSWYLLGPLTILACLIALIVAGWDLTIRKNYTYPSWCYLIGWILVCGSMCFLPIFAVSAYKKAPSTNVFNRLNRTLTPCPEPEPKPVWDPQQLIVLKHPQGISSPQYEKGNRSTFDEAETKC